jgi:coproporphyrinogen III oxidase
MINQVKTYLLALQADICAQLEAVDTEATFIKDQWEKPDNDTPKAVKRRPASSGLSAVADAGISSPCTIE